MDTVTKFITEILKKVLMLLMAAIVIDVTWQVFTRFVLKHPSSFTEELAGFLLIWIGLLGASYALHTKMHLGIDVLTEKVSRDKKHIVEIAIYGIVVLFAFFIPVIGGMNLVTMTFTLRQISPAMGIPVGYVYLVLPLTGLLMMYYSVVFIIKAFKNKHVQ